EENQKFSLALSAFANQAADIVEKHAGCPIYMGGDDVMALLPLHTLIEGIGELRRAFDAVSGNYQVFFRAGIVIAHELEPLSEVLRLARSAESSAKKIGGKNALAIVVCPRSGANVEAAGKWNTILPLLKTIADAYLAEKGKDEKLSLGFAHELRKLE